MSKLSNGHWYLDQDGVVYEYVGNYGGALLARKRGESDLSELAIDPEDLVECTPDGGKLVPEPAAGQVFWSERALNEFVINLVTLPSGRKAYMAISESGYRWGHVESTPAEASEGMTYVRTIPSL